MKALFDANVVITGAGWRGESHLCLVQLARRRVQVFASASLLDEIRDTASDLEARGQFPHPALDDPQLVLRRRAVGQPCSFGQSPQPRSQGRRYANEWSATFTRVYAASATHSPVTLRNSPSDRKVQMVKRPEGRAPAPALGWGAKHLRMSALPTHKP